VILSFARNRGKWKESGGSKDLNALQHQTLNFAQCLFSACVFQAQTLINLSTVVRFFFFFVQLAQEVAESNF